MNVFWIPVVAIIGGIGMVIAIVYAGAATRQHKAKLRAEVQMKLIDRFGSAAEFIQFVQSDEGKRFLGDPPTVARSNYVGGIRNGIMLGCIGLGFAVIGVAQHDTGWLVPAFILLGVGGGFFASSMVSMKLARQMETGGQLPRP